jgi:hypothetical protein
MEQEKKPPDKDGLFWRILAIIGVIASISSLIVSLISLLR